MYNQINLTIEWFKEFKLDIDNNIYLLHSYRYVPTTCYLYLRKNDY